MLVCFQRSQNKAKPRQLKSNSNVISQPLKTFELCPKGWSFPSQGVLPKLQLKLPTVRAPLGELGSDYSIHGSMWESLGLFIYDQCVSLLCKVLQTHRFSKLESFRGHCSFDLNLCYVHPKELSFGINLMSPIFISLKTPRHKGM